VFGTGLYINSISENENELNCDSCSLYVKCGIKNTADLAIPILYFYATKNILANVEILWNYDTTL
jgi:hypothetical protein